MPSCAACGAANPIEARFCNACGASLEATPAPTRARREVTIVFSDLAGSTAMGERLDPETVRGVLARYFSSMREILERHGGTVEKYIGDAIMAVFGLNRVHEDDALRAVRAAGEMRFALLALNEEFRRTYDVMIETRTGVMTGEVVIGDPGAGGTLVTGDAVNTAARLEQAAPVGEVVLGEPTYRLVAHAIEAEPLEPIVAKGKALPVSAYRLIAVVGSPNLRPRRFASPMVGRDTALATLLDAFEHVLSASTCRLITILGEPGVGKSRLVEEFLARVEGRAKVLTGRCLSYGQGITYWPVTQAIRQAVAVDEDEGAEEIAAKVRRLLDATEPGVAERVISLLGIGDAIGTPNETAWAVRRLLEEAARTEPVLLLIEDLHWAEPALLDLISYLPQHVRTARVALVCTARPDLIEERPAWVSDGAAVATISLQPLDEQLVGALIGNLLGAPGLDPAISATIGKAAGGNPLFVEELLAMLLDEGAIRPEEDGWRVVGDVSHMSIPPSINALLAARLDRLPAEERAVIGPASVIGEVFYGSAVHDLVEEHVRPRVPTILRSLAARDLVRPAETELFAEATYRFRHILIRDAAYTARPKEERATLHEGFGDWLEARAGDRVADVQEIIGYHFEQAFRLRTELRPASAEDRRLADRAAAHLGAAGNRALTRGDVGAAVNLLGRALDLQPSDDPSRLRQLLALGEASIWAGDLRRASSVLSDVVTEARRQGDIVAEARAHVWQLFVEGSLDPHRSTLEANLAEAERLLADLEPTGDEAALSAAWLMVGQHRAWLGANLGAQDAFTQAARNARSSGDRRIELLARTYHLIASFQGATPATQVIEEADRVFAQATGQPMFAAEATLTKAYMKAMLGETGPARELRDRALRAFEDMGAGLSRAGWGMYLGDIDLLGGDPAGAEAIMRDARRLLEEMGERGYLSSVDAYLAEAVYRQGRLDEAERFTKSSEANASADDLESHLVSDAIRAKVIARRGDHAAAEGLVRQAVAIAGRTEWIDLQGRTLMDLAEVLHVAGQAEEAISAALEALDRFERKENLVGSERAKAFIREMERRQVDG